VRESVLRVYLGPRLCQACQQGLLSLSLGVRVLLRLEVLRLLVADLLVAAVLALPEALRCRLGASQQPLQEREGVIPPATLGVSE
jgi:hypothetical protein